MANTKESKGKTNNASSSKAKPAGRNDANKPGVNDAANAKGSSNKGNGPAGENL